MARRSRYGGPFTPTKGPFAGQQFDSYFKYRQETAKQEGFKSYSEKRRVRKERKQRPIIDVVPRHSFVELPGTGFWQYGPDMEQWDTAPALDMVDRDRIVAFISSHFADSDHVQISIGGYWDVPSSGPARPDWQSQLWYMRDVVPHMQAASDWQGITARLMRGKYGDVREVYAFAIRKTKAGAE